MLDYFFISLLIIGGIGLIIIEIIFVPGTTIVGIFGFLMGIYGVYRTYNLYGSSIGHLVLALSVTVSFVSIYYSFKSGAWRKFALRGSIDSKVNENLTSVLELGMEGKSISALKPSGKGEFDDVEYEVASLGSYIEENQSIRIIKIERNKIHVESIN